jgi:hypothetical protein
MTDFSLTPLTPISFSDAVLTQAAISAAARREPKLTIMSPNPGDVFYIDKTPQMPNIPCEVRVAGVTPDPTASTVFDWSISITEVVTPRKCASSKVGPCTLKEQGRGGPRWTPAFGGLQGGDAEITVSTVVDGVQLSSSVKVKVRGQNPDFETVVDALGGAGSDANQIACVESNHYQFYQPDFPPKFTGVPGMPFEGPGGDVGIMQLCTPASCTQRWDWRANVQSGLTLLAESLINAGTYLSTNAISGGTQQYPNDQGFSDAEVIRREGIQLYNGPRGAHYWKWDATANQWTKAPPSDYVDHVLKCHKRDG